MVKLIYIYYGILKGIDTTSYLEIEGIYPVYGPYDNWYWRGLSSITIGDFNNDGYDDIVIGTPWYQQAGGLAAKGYAIVYLSNSDGSGLDMSNFIELMGLSSIGRFAVLMHNADVNGDDIDDLIITADLDGNYEGRIYIFYGGNEFNKEYDKVLSYNKGCLNKFF